MEQDDDLGLNDLPMSPGREIEETRAYQAQKFIGGIKKIDDIEARGAGVGMTKAFGALGGVMLEQDAVINQKYQAKENRTAVLHQV